MNPSVSAARIRPILIDADAIESYSLRKSESSTGKSNSGSKWLKEKRDVLLVILAIFIGVVFTVSSALPTYFPKGYLLFLSGIAIFFLYILLADYIMPEFFIKLGSHEISSYRLMWILALSYIFAGTLLLLVGKYLLLGFNKFADWLIMRRLHDSISANEGKQSGDIEME
ncbi:hypothetical protein Q3G72_009775 [Acer saccharum]|nr:hypothetical protein Q3G72_009775 [Acer saccharum]